MGPPPGQRALRVSTRDATAGQHRPVLRHRCVAARESSIARLAARTGSSTSSTLTIRDLSQREVSPAAAMRRPGRSGRGGLPRRPRLDSGGSGSKSSRSSRVRPRRRRQNCSDAPSRGGSCGRASFAKRSSSTSAASGRARLRQFDPPLRTPSSSEAPQAELTASMWLSMSKSGSSPSSDGGGSSWHEREALTGTGAQVESTGERVTEHLQGQPRLESPDAHRVHRPAGRLGVQERLICARSVAAERSATRQSTLRARVWRA